jgi:hypothetical protein
MDATEVVGVLTGIPFPLVLSPSFSHFGDDLSCILDSSIPLPVFHISRYDTLLLRLLYRIYQRWVCLSCGRLGVTFHLMASRCLGLHWRGVLLCCTDHVGWQVSCTLYYYLQSDCLLEPPSSSYTP